MLSDGPILITLSLRKILILKSLKHQNIVEVHKCLTMKNMEVVIIMEYLEGGDLLKYVTAL